MTSSSIPAARSQYLLDLFAQIPDLRKKRGRRHRLAGLLAVGVAAVIAGSKSFAAIGQWAADADPEALAVLGAVRGAARGGVNSPGKTGFAFIVPAIHGPYRWRYDLLPRPTFATQPSQKRRSGAGR